MNINKVILSVIVLLNGSFLMAMERSDEAIIQIPSESERASLVNESEIKELNFYNKTKKLLENNKKTVMATGSATLGIASNIFLNPVAATIFLGTFGTSIKGILPKSTDKQALKIGAAIAVGALAVGTDLGLNYLGFNTNWAFSNCALIGGMAVLKRVQKGHIKADAKEKNKKDKKAEKKERIDVVLED